jgi:hypothetical protein
MSFYFYHVCVALDRALTDDELAKFRTQLVAASSSKQNPDYDRNAPKEALHSTGVNNVPSNGVAGNGNDVGDIDVCFETSGGATVAAEVVGGIVRQIVGDECTAYFRVKRL